MIDRLKLQSQATELQTLLGRYAPDNPSIERCRRELEPLFRELEKPEAHIDEEAAIPCARFVTEGGFEPWPDLLDAYSAFYVTLKDLGDVKIPED